MELKEIEVYSEASNVAVVNVGRAYPGSVIQGDSLYILHRQIMDIVEHLSSDPEHDMFYEALDMAEKLEGRLLHYNEVCAAHGIKKMEPKKTVKNFEHLVEDDL